MKLVSVGNSAQTLNPVDLGLVILSCVGGGFNLSVTSSESLEIENVGKLKRAKVYFCSADSIVIYGGIGYKISIKE
jgi:hypothetical protein